MNQHPARSFATEAEARAEARRLGDGDARTTCASFGLTDQVVSASVTPVTWSCIQLDGRFTCGFEGDLVCRVQRRAVSLQERCNELGGR